MLNNFVKYLMDNAVFQVYPTPTIAVLSTGDELMEPTTSCLSRGQVHVFVFFERIGTRCLKKLQCAQIMCISEKRVAIAMLNS